MGFQENGNGELGLSGIPLGAKNKYERMNSEFPEDNDDILQQENNRRSTTRKYVIGCAIFASLNNVLLGYGMLSLKKSLILSLQLLHFSLTIMLFRSCC